MRRTPRGAADPSLGATLAAIPRELVEVYLAIADQTSLTSAGEQKIIHWRWLELLRFEMERKER